MRELGLFAGAGGGLLASAHLLGWRTICAVEIDQHCQACLRQRQRDGMLDPFPIWDDIRTFDGRPWRGLVDVVSGGFPCQDISSAGRGAGLDGDRSSLWFEMLRVIGEVRPAYVFAENSPMLRTRGLDRVLGGLARMGFDVGWGVLGAWHVGAPHRRNRMWFVAANADVCRERGLTEHAEVGGTQDVERHDAADTNRERPQRGSPTRGGLAEAGRRAPTDGRYASDPDGAGSPPRGPGECAQPAGLAAAERSGAPGRSDWWSVHRFAGVDDGVASRLERVRATGNGQVPRVAALAWSTLSNLVHWSQPK